MSKLEVLKIKSRIRTKFWLHFYERHLIFQCNLNIKNNRKRSNIPKASVLERIRQEYQEPWLGLSTCCYIRGSGLCPQHLNDGSQSQTSVPRNPMPLLTSTAPRTQVVRIYTSSQNIHNK